MLIIRGIQRLRLWLFPVVLTISLSVLYGSQLPSSYTAVNDGADGGDLLAAVLTGGVPHPTGYPTYLLVATYFQGVPLGAPYWKGALLSLVFSALAACLAPYAIQGAREKNSQITIPGMVAAGLAIGLAPAFWSQAVIVEVYGLQAFFTACCLLWIKHVSQGEASAQNDVGLVSLSILIGLGVGNHLLILLLFPALGLAALVAWQEGAPIYRLLKYAALTSITAALVYAALPIRAHGNPPVNWGNPQTLDGFFWLVSGQLYHDLAFGLPASQILPRIAYCAGWLLHQFGLVGLLLGLLGTAVAFFEQQRLKWAYVWVFGASVTFSIGYLTNDSTVYLIPAGMVFALWIGTAVDRLWVGVLGLSTHPIINRLMVGAFFLSLVISLPAVYQEVDPRRDVSASEYAESCLEGLPDRALVITQSDQDTFPLWYYHYGLGQRPDVGLVAQRLSDFGWYAESMQYVTPPVELPAQGDENWNINLARRNPGRPVCQCGGAAPSSPIELSCINGE